MAESRRDGGRCVAIERRDGLSLAWGVRAVGKAVVYDPAATLHDFECCVSTALLM